MTDISGGKKSLLAQAADAARTDTGVGDVPRFLDAYYRHVASEDLAEAGADQAAELAADLERVLGDVRAAVEDHPKMHARALALADSLALTAPSADDDAESAGEVEALLRWLADGHFTFLGYREYDLVDG